MAEICVAGAAVGLSKEGYNIISRHTTQSQVKRGTQYLEEAMDVLKGDTNNLIEPAMRKNILTAYNDVMTKREGFNGRKKLPHGLRPQTVLEAHEFKQQAKAVYKITRSSSAAAIAMAQQKIVSKSEGSIKQGNNREVKGEFDWVDNGSGKRLVPRKHATNGVSDEFKSQRPLPRQKSSKTLKHEPNTM